MAVTIAETGIAFSADQFVSAPPFSAYSFTCPGDAQTGDILLMRLHMRDNDLVTYSGITDWVIPDGVTIGVGSAWTLLLTHRFLGSAVAPSSGAYRSQWAARRLLESDLGTSWSFRLLTSGDSSWQDRGEYFLVRGAAALPVVYHDTGTAFMPRPPGGAADYLADIVTSPISVVAGDFVLSERKAKIEAGPPFLSVLPAGNYAVSPVFSEDFFNHFIGAPNSAFTYQTTIDVGPPSGSGRVFYSVASFHFATADRTGTISITLPVPTFSATGVNEKRGTMSLTLPVPTLSATGAKFAAGQAGDIMFRKKQNRTLFREKKTRLLRRPGS